jgi:hypothetical protein
MKCSERSSLRRARYDLVADYGHRRDRSNDVRTSLSMCLKEACEIVELMMFACCFRGATFTTWLLQMTGTGLGSIYGLVVLEIFRNVGGYKYNPFVSLGPLRERHPLNNFISLGMASRRRSRLGQRSPRIGFTNIPSTTPAVSFS